MLQQFRSDQKIQWIGMNQVEYVRFTNNKSGLATANLNSCTAVLIVSQTAAILGHFAPLSPQYPPDPGSGNANIHAGMREVSNLLHSHQQDFPQHKSTGLIAYAIYKGEIALPSQKAIIEGYFKQWGIPLNLVGYDVHIDARQNRPPEKGTVVIHNQNGRVSVFVEDKQKAVITNSSSGSSYAESSKAAASR